MLDSIKCLIPNLLTSLRIVVIPIVAYGLYYNTDVSIFWSGIIFVFACIGDVLDGYFARKWSVQSYFGKIFDLIADKVLIICVVSLLIYNGFVYTYEIVCVVIMILREIVVSVCRFNAHRLNLEVPVIALGKYKTFYQMWSIGFIMSRGVDFRNVGPGSVLGVDLESFYISLNVFMNYGGSVTIFIATVLSVLSAYFYVRMFLKSTSVK